MRKSFKNKWILLILIVILFSFNYSTRVLRASSTTSPPPGFKVLILVSGGFGLTYFDAKDQFESWGWIVDTAGTASTLSSCANQDIQVIQTDFLIENVNSAIFAQYDCIFIPSGGHWNHLSHYEDALQLISSAYDSGLIIASLCIGMVVIARAGILDGVRIAQDNNAWSYMYDSGAIMTQQEVVTDKRIITGGQGGGPSGGGASLAPTIELCEAIALEVQGRRMGIIIGVTSGVLGSIAIVGLILFLRKHKTK
jgi:putative intracellular protease/amidase